jgi:hypothetical protein
VEPNDWAERRGIAPTNNESALCQSSTLLSLAEVAIARDRSSRLLDESNRDIRKIGDIAQRYLKEHSRPRQMCGKFSQS